MTIRTQAQLNNEIQTSLPDNVIGQITPSILRSFEQDVCDTMFSFPNTNPAIFGQLAANQTWTGINIFSNTSTFSSTVTINSGVLTLFGSSSGIHIVNTSDLQVFNTSAGNLNLNVSSGSILFSNASSTTFTCDNSGNLTVVGTINGLTLSASTGIFTLTNAKTLAVTNTLTLSGTDGKTLTVSNSLALAGTDSTVMTFPSTSQTVVGLTATQTLTNKTLTSPILTTPNIGVATGTSLSTTGALTALSSTATAAGGAATPAITFGSANIGIYWGSGAPSSLTGVQGSIYIRTDGAAGTAIYYNTTGSTTWVAVT